MSTICPKCGTDQKFPSVLKRHLARKTPCSLIIAPEELPAADRMKKHKCKYCGRSFTTETSMYRHVRHRCKIANSDEGMEKLMEYTLQRQLAEQSAQIANLTAMVERLATGHITVAPPQLATSSGGVGTLVEKAMQVNTGSVTNIGQQQVNIVQIAPWDGDRRIFIGLAEIAAAFAENERLKEYARLGDHELVDPEIAPPYVTDLLMDLTKRAHADPEARNIYLNPRRADQALVLMKTGKWEVLTLNEATRLMFDGVVRGIMAVSRKYEENRQLPLEAQNALAMAGLMYGDEPDEYARRAKVPMAAHLSNTRPEEPCALAAK